MGFSRGFPFENREPLRVDMEHFSGVLFVVSPRFFFQFLFQGLFYLRESFDAVFQATEPFVCAFVNAVVLVSRTMEYFVDGGRGYMVFFLQIADADVSQEVIVGEFLSLKRSKPRSLVDDHSVYKNCYLFQDTIL